MQRGEIYFVDHDPVIGKEQHGRRPVLVLSIDALNRIPLGITVVPGTTAANVKRAFQSNVRASTSESGLPNETEFLCFQVRALDHSRFTDPPAGQLSDAALQRVEQAVRYCLGL
jgi:mRNA interferase MazF